MRIFTLPAVAAGLALTVFGSAAAAQSMTGPPGSVRGLFGAGGPPSPGRTTQQVSTWFDIGGGHDRNEVVGNAAGPTTLEGYATTALGGFRFWRGRTTRSVEATARIFRNDQRAGRTTATGGEVNLTGTMQIGRRGGVNIALRGANDSAVLFGAFGAGATPAAPGIDAEINVPDVSPQQGIVTDRWYSFGGNAGAFRNWTPRQRTAAVYSQVRRQPTAGDGLDSDQRLASVRHDWMLRMNTGIIGSYRFEQVRQTFPNVAATDPVRTQAAEIGLRYERRFTPNRVLAGTVQVGTTQVLDSATLRGADAFEPTGGISATYTLTRRWSVLAGATKSITVLQGVTQAPFSNELVSLSVNGVLARRVTVTVAGSFSQGSAIGASSGSFEAVGGTATLRYAFRYGGLFAGYTRYEHRVRDVAPAAGAIAPRFDQQSIRAGVTLWLPLYGAF